MNITINLERFILLTLQQPSNYGGAGGEKNGNVAQQEEHLGDIEKRVGSKPTGPTI